MLNSARLEQVLPRAPISEPARRAREARLGRRQRLGAAQLLREHRALVSSSFVPAVGFELGLSLGSARDDVDFEGLGEPVRVRFPLLEDGHPSGE